MSKEIRKDKFTSKLTDKQYKVLRNKFTEKAFTGKYWDHKERGVYLCAGCGNALFSFKSKFDSGTGWPSFYEPENKKAIVEKDDTGRPIKRTEVLCSKCKGHLGHVFNDGPAPTGLRYCINSAALNFKKHNQKAANNE